MKEFKIDSFICFAKKKKSIPRYIIQVILPAHTVLANTIKSPENKDFEFSNFFSKYISALILHSWGPQKYTQLHFKPNIKVNRAS